MEDSGKPRGLAGLDPERDDVLHLEVDRIADADAVAEPFLDYLQAKLLDTGQLAGRT